MLWLWLTRSGLLASGGIRTIAHFAPEPALRSRLLAVPGASYRSADLEPGRADETVDVTDIPWPDGSVDLLVCAHVLEHVPDDAAALAELRRILAPEGHAIIEVPVLRERTDEDPLVTDPAERLRRFGQTDHVRVYGRDYYDRLAAAGFAVSHHDVRHLVSPRERARFGLVHHLPFMDPQDDRLWEVVLCRRAPGIVET